MPKEKTPLSALAGSLPMDPVRQAQQRAIAERLGVRWPIGSVTDAFAFSDVRIEELESEREALLAAFWLLDEVSAWPHTSVPHDDGQAREHEACPRCDASQHALATARAVAEHRAPTAAAA